MTRGNICLFNRKGSMVSLSFVRLSTVTRAAEFLFPFDINGVSEVCWPFDACGYRFRQYEVHFSAVAIEKVCQSFSN